MKNTLVSKTLLFSICFSLNSFIYAQNSIIWELNRLDSIGGLPVTTEGNPKLIETDEIVAIEFDGVQDGIFIPTNPLSGAEEFTIEILFKPYSGGLEEQRFIHFQQDNDNRVLMELRSVVNNKWYFDTFIKSGTSSKTLVVDTCLHDNNKWYHAALVYCKDTMKHYVDGNMELSGLVDFNPVSTGTASIGVRQNLVSWYKGAIKTIKITHKALNPDEFMKSEMSDTSINIDTNQSGSVINNNSFRVRNFQIFPIPFRQNGNLNIDVSKIEKMDIDIYSVTGQKSTLIKDWFLNPGVNQVPIQLSSFDEGLYCLMIKLDDYQISRQIIVLE